MKNTIFLLSLTLLFSVGWSITINEIGNEILEEIWYFHPVGATYLGIHKYDTLLPDYSQNTLNKMLSRFNELEKILNSIDTLTLSPDELIDYYLLKIDLFDEIFTMQMRKSYEKDPFVYVTACVYGVYTIMIRSSPSTHIKIDAVKKRLKQVPDFLENATKNLRHPSQILCEIAIEQLTEGEQFIKDIFETYKDSLPQREKSDFQQIKNKAIAAMKWFAYWLEKNGDPNAPYTLGRDHYEYKLKYIHLLDVDADSLLEFGKSVLKSTSAKIDSLEKFNQTQRKKIVLPTDFNRDDVLAYQREEIEFMHNFVAQSDIVTIPDWIGALEVVETPAFLRGIIPGVAIDPPGPFDDSNISYFYVQPIPMKFDLGQAEYYYNYVHNRWFRRSVIHEGYPGHHLQLSIANHHPSFIRKSFHDYFFIEGWALYCEELMTRSGLYKDTLGAIINSLYGIKFRATRMIVDVMLQTRAFSYEDAVNFMVETVGGDSIFLASEVKRYITSPGQPSSYLFGKLQILHLLDEYKAAIGDKFVLKDFHDMLLKQGSIPIILIKKIMMSDIR